MHKFLAFTKFEECKIPTSSPQFPIPPAFA